METTSAGEGSASNASERNSSSSKTSDKEDEEVAAAVSLLEFCANLEDYTPTVGII